jgi:putative ATPase
MLPWVENGTVILIGATTENPYFEVNKALVSRSRIFQLKLLNEADLRGVLEQALTDSERGYGELSVIVEPDAICASQQRCCEALLRSAAAKRYRTPKCILHQL